MDAEELRELMKLRHRVVHNAADREATVRAVMELIPRMHFHIVKGRLYRTRKDGQTTRLTTSWLEVYLAGRYIFVCNGEDEDPPPGLARLVEKALLKRVVSHD
jgi:hypothetical protein